MSRSTPGLTVCTTKPTRAVIVMGPAGTGKTSLVNGATNADFHVDDMGLEHCTKKIQWNRANLGVGVYIDVVDTPALDSKEAEREIAEYLRQLGRDAIIGVIFMLNINATVNAEVVESCGMFHKLCGLSNMGNAAIVTEVPRDEERRVELGQIDPFKQILGGGASMFVFKGTQESATCIIRTFANKQPATLACLGDQGQGGGPPADDEDPLQSPGATCSCFSWLPLCHK